MAETSTIRRHSVLPYRGMVILCPQTGWSFVIRRITRLGNTVWAECGIEDLEERGPDDPDYDPLHGDWHIVAYKDRIYARQP